MKSTTIKVLLPALLMLGATCFSSAQESRVWLTIGDNMAVPYQDSDGRLRSDDSTFNHYINTLGIFNCKKALPASRMSELQKVYELTCNCTLSELTSVLNNQVSVVSGVYPAPIYDTLHTPNDYSLSLGINNYALNLINAQQAWDITKGDTNVVVAITDQNYSPNHSELIGKYVHLYQGNVTPTHGNAVSILAAGNTNNNNGLSSIGYNCRLGLYNMNYNEIISASYAGYKVINISWTSGCYYNPYEQQCVNEAYNNGSFLVAAAGNGTLCGGAWPYLYPASYQNVFSVTSIGQNDSHIHYGNDTTTTHQHNNMVDLSAPGYDVAVNPNEGWYINSSGTSYASPIVSGTIGLMLSANPCLSRIDIDTILKISAVNIDTINPLFVGKIGAGRLNAYAAVQIAQSWTTQPMQVITQPVNAYVPPGATAQFSASSTSSFPVYKWQYDSSGIFVNLTNNNTYSGVNTAVLTITNVPQAFNNYQYRCVMSSGLCQAITTPGILTVSNSGTIPDTAGAIQQPAYVCFGDTVQFSISPVNYATGYNWSVTGNSTIVFGQNTTTVSVVILDTAFTISVIPVNSYGAGVGSLINTGSGPLATASFAGGATICSGDSTTLVLNLTGNGPWSGLLNNSIPFSTTTSPAYITVAPTATTDFILTDLTAGHCPAFPDYFSTMATVTVLPLIYDTTQLSVCSTQFPIVWHGMSISSPGYYDDTIANSTTCDSLVTLHVTILPGNPPLAPSSVTQTLISNTCFSRTYRYVASITLNSIGYQWIIPTSCGGVGPVIVDSGDINSSRIIRLTYYSNNASFTTDSIKVRAYNTCSYGPYKSVRLINTALNPPSKPAFITVSSLVTDSCGLRKYRYTAPSLPVATSTATAATGYLWSFTAPMPLQGVIDSGNLNSSRIVVKYPSNLASNVTDSIYLQYTSACGNSLARALRINISAINPPVAPGSISITALNTNTCGNRKYRLTMPLVPTASGSYVAATGYLWTLTGHVGQYSIVDSGSLTSRVVVIRYTDDNATTVGDTIKAQYTSQCGNGTARALKFSILKLTAPPAPAFINITAVSPSVCGARIYRYAAPSLYSGTNSISPATGYAWSFTGVLGSYATIDSGTINSQVIRVKYLSNAAAVAGDSVRVKYLSSCGFSPNKSSKLTNTVLTGCPPLIASQPVERRRYFRDVKRR